MKPLLLQYHPKLSIAIEVMFNRSNLHSAQSKSSPMLGQITENQQIFDSLTYKFISDNSQFEVVFAKANQFQQVKTYLQLTHKLSPDELHLITNRIAHKNLVNLRKIGKSKKQKQQNLYWLYYEPVEFSLEYYLSNNLMHTINCQSDFVKALQDIKILFKTNNIFVPILWENIGVNALGIIKIYFPAYELIESWKMSPVKSQKQTEVKLTKNFQEIYNKFKLILTERKLRNQQNFNKQRKTQPKQVIKTDSSLYSSPHKASTFSKNRFQKIRKDLQTIKQRIKYDENKTIGNRINANKSISPQDTSPQCRFNQRNMRSQSQYRVDTTESKYKTNNFKRTTTIDPSSDSRKVEPFKGQQPEIDLKLSDQKIHQQNINCINIYHHTNQILDSNRNTHDIEKRMAVINSNLKNIHHNHHYYNNPQYDEESVDTYQMEMGEDFQMPTIAPSQNKLRQTSLVPNDKWETYTSRIKGKKNDKSVLAKPSKNNFQVVRGFHQSAGNNFFSQFYEKNKGQIQRHQDSQEQQTLEINAKKTQLESNLLESRTVNDHRMLKEHKKKTIIDTAALSSKNQHQWQSATIKSASPTTIQDRVQQALTKTRNVMTILKNPKSSSLRK